MPTGTSVHNLYTELLSQGYDQKNAAKIAQAKIGLALATGRPPKTHTLSKSRKKYYGQRYA